ncbi:MAG: type II secretion system protein GspD [Pirellulaceae bacterium]
MDRNLSDNSPPPRKRATLTLVMWLSACLVATNCIAQQPGRYESGGGRAIGARWHPVQPASYSGQSTTGSPTAIQNPFEFLDDPSGITSSEGGSTVRIPLQTSVGRNPNLQISRNAANQKINIYANNVDLRVILDQLADESGVNIIVAESIQASVTTTLKDVPLWDALDAILRINNLVWTERENIIYVTNPSGAGGGEGTGRALPGQELQVFDLYYTSAEETLEVVNGLLSAGGRAFLHSVDSKSTRHTRERIVVEDYPERLRAVAMYLASVDTPPQQVLIEANVLQVSLDDNQRHGVNLLGLARLAGARINVQSQGFADGGSSPGFMMGLEGTDLNGMIETLCSNSNVETLAAPKVLVVNGQEARIQIGSKFGYFVTTTTETSTLQSVDFLDIGVVLTVTPTITRDGQVLLSVLPKVSGGRINPDTGLPEEDTTEAETTVILPDGKGMIIGGLIKENSENQKWWAPFIGEKPFIGKLFSRTNNRAEREEVVISLVPHIVPYNEALDHREYHQYNRATRTTAAQDEYWRTPRRPAQGLNAPYQASRKAAGGQAILNQAVGSQLNNRQAASPNVIQNGNANPMQGVPTVPTNGTFHPAINSAPATQFQPMGSPSQGAPMLRGPAAQSLAPVIPGAPTVPGR